MQDSRQLEPFQCGLCQMKFSKLTDFYKHLHTHNEDLSSFFHVCKTEPQAAPDDPNTTDAIQGKHKAAAINTDTDSAVADNIIERKVTVEVTCMDKELTCDQKQLDESCKREVPSACVRLPRNDVLHCCGSCGYEFPSICLLHCHMNMHTCTNAYNEAGEMFTGQSYRYNHLTNTAYPEHHYTANDSQANTSRYSSHTNTCCPKIPHCTDNQTNLGWNSYHTNTAYPESQHCKNNHDNVTRTIKLIGTQNQLEDETYLPGISTEKTINHGAIDLSILNSTDDVDDSAIGDNDEDDAVTDTSTATENVSNSFVVKEDEKLQNDSSTISDLQEMNMSDYMNTSVKNETTDSIKRKRNEKKFRKQPVRGKKKQEKQQLREGKSNQSVQGPGVKLESDIDSTVESNQMLIDTLLESQLSTETDLSIPVKYTNKKNMIKTHLKSPKLEQCMSCMKLYTPIYLKRHTCKTMYYHEIKDFTEDEEYKKCQRCCKVYQKVYFKSHTCRFVTPSTKVKVQRSRPPKEPNVVCGEGGEMVTRPVYRCKECPAEYPLQSTLRMHVWNKHAKRDLHVCDTCGSSFKRAYLLRNHIAQHHTKERLYACHICAKTFVSQTRLNLHIVTHSDVRQYTCDICGSTYKSEVNLRKHMMLHEQKFSFECNYCGKGFVDKSRSVEHLRSHERVACDDSLGKCDICGKIFKADAIEMHKKLVHNDDYCEKSVCTICKKPILNRILVGHMHRRHGVKIELRTDCQICGKNLSAVGLLKHVKAKHLIPTKTKKEKAKIKPRKFSPLRTALMADQDDADNLSAGNENSH